MKPVTFPEQTTILGAPQGVSKEDCGGLPIIKLNTAKGEHVGFSSCWELTQDEWLDIKNNGLKLWLTVHGIGHPMIDLSVDKPFTTTVKEDAQY